MKNLATTTGTTSIHHSAKLHGDGAKANRPAGAAAQTPLRTAALVAGVAMLAMAVIAPLCIFGVIGRLTVADDATATAANLVASAGLFRLAAVGVLVVALLDVVVAWGLDELLHGVHRSLSKLGAWLRLIYAALFAVAAGELFAALRAAPTNPAEALFRLDGFQQGWQIALVVFGVHLVVVGALVWRAPFISRVFGALLVVAGLGYFVDGLGVLLSPSYALSLGSFTFVGELLFMCWLLARGRKLGGAEPPAS